MWLQVERERERKFEPVVHGEVPFRPVSPTLRLALNLRVEQELPLALETPAFIARATGDQSPI